MIELVKKIIRLSCDLAKMFLVTLQFPLLVPMGYTKSLYISDNHKWLREYHRDGNWYHKLAERSGVRNRASHYTKEKK